MNERVTITMADREQATRETGWTDTRKKVALALFNSGLSARQVACEIGATRNAVIGMVHRAGGSDRDRPLPLTSNGNANGVHAKPFRRRPQQTLGRVGSPRKDAEPAPPPIVDSAIPQERRRSVIELDSTCCHWPVGDPGAPGFFFCGARVRPGKPYCPAHHLRSIDSAGTRRSNKASGQSSHIEGVFSR